MAFCVVWKLCNKENSGVPHVNLNTSPANKQVFVTGIEHVHQPSTVQTDRNLPTSVFVQLEQVLHTDPNVYNLRFHIFVRGGAGGARGSLEPSGVP